MTSGILASAIIGVLKAAGYGGLMLLMAAESACIPLPSEIILPFAGFLVATGQMNLFLVATLGALGCNLGSAVAYWVGRWGGRRAIERWGKYILLSQHDLALSDRFFARFGAAAVLIGRMLPVIRTFIALPAGIARMKQPQFHLYTFLGSWPWCFLLAYIGYLLGSAGATSPILGTVFHVLDIAVVAGILILVARLAWSRWRSRRSEGELR